MEGFRGLGFGGLGFGGSGNSPLGLMVWVYSVGS